MKQYFLQTARSVLAFVLALCLVLPMAVPGLAAETVPATEPATEPAPDLRENLFTAVDAAVEDLGLTKPEGEIRLPMLDNYVAGKHSSYVALGDASARGESYVPLLAEELGVSFVNLTPANLHTPVQAQAVILANREDIAAADIITLGCQSTAALTLPDLDVTLPDIELPDLDLPDIDLPDLNLPDLDLPELELPDWGDLEDKFPEPTDTELLTAALKAYVNSCGAYARGLPRMVESVRRINPDAVVVVVGMYDPLDSMTVTLEGESLALEGLLDGLVEAVNLHAAAYCQTSKNAIYVDIPDVQTSREAAGMTGAVDVSRFLRILSLEGDSLLPSLRGREYIRDRILSSLIRVYRLAGDTRFHTAIKAADAMKDNLNLESFDSILIASGSGFADALSGSYLAAVKNAPILLSYTTQWNRLAADYIHENLSPDGTVYILGGPAAVPEELETMLEGLRVVRLAGENRFETNLKVLQEAGVSDRELLVCTGADFADSLSASALGLPILLVNDSLYADQQDFLSALQEPVFTVIGGESAVAPAIAQELTAWGTVERVAGENRIETSIAIAERYFEKPESIVLAGATSYPDGLCGGVLAGSMGSPLLLTAAGYGKTIATYAGPREIDSGILLGGRGTVTDSVARFAFGLSISTEIPIQ